jgi:hypothetical protein
METTSQGDLSRQSIFLSTIRWRVLLYPDVSLPRSRSYVFRISKNSRDGVLRETFQDACAARGLLETDDEWDSCLTEATTIDTGNQLRELFVGIVLYNNQ